jgi:hypothetical protein
MAPSHPANSPPGTIDLMEAIEKDDVGQPQMPMNTGGGGGIEILLAYLLIKDDLIRA